MLISSVRMWVPFLRFLSQCIYETGANSKSKMM